MRLSIVIVNYNVRHFLEQCLRSVYKALGDIPAEVFVVDNNSVDGSNQMVEELFPQVKLIANTDNVGFSSANNQAIRESQGEHVLLLNPDTVVPENAFEEILNFMDQHPEAGALGVHMIDGQGRFLPESKRGLPTPEVALYKMLGLNKIFPKSEKFGKYHLGYLDEHQTHEVDVLSGAFMLLRKEALDKVGLLDETFFMYGEDIDLSYRMTLGGYRNYYFSGITIIHYKGESTKKRSANYVKIFYKAMIIFAEKHYKGRYQKWFTGLINFAIYLRAGAAMLMNFARTYWSAALEAVLIFLTMLALKSYWEEHIKFIREYPPEMLYIHLPYYTLSWVFSIHILGGYKQLFKFNRLIQGILLGTAVIFMILGLLPDELHYSRGIILFGTLLVMAVLIAWRTLYHFLKYKTLDFSLRDTTRSILVGSPSKWKWVSDVLADSGKSYQKIGFVSDEGQGNEDWLGNRNQLKEIVRVFQVNEVIFSAEGMDSQEIMQWMNEIGPTVNYYIIPDNTGFVIGSHSKNANGLYFGQHIELNLSRKEYRSRKRAFDIITSIVLLILFPIFFWLAPKSYFKDCLQVLGGSRTWLGYSGNSTELPALKPGIMHTDYDMLQANAIHQKQLDALYAKNYNLSQDFAAVLKYLF
ncbi:glycosyltransferase [bacterium]|nr:glycosyltransferase [bacterium]